MLNDSPIWVPSDGCTCPWKFCGETTRDNTPPDPCSLGHRPKRYVKVLPTIENTEPNPSRMWRCEECGHTWADEELRRLAAEAGGYGHHPCHSNPRARKPWKCESYLAPFVPELRW